ncbi:hypothetical protein BD413DRAFT_612056 [Trametes elegans]|nr:hypothetical protein BD413DRAFT_612056 [Trametes elegans]
MADPGDEAAVGLYLAEASPAPFYGLPPIDAQSRNDSPSPEELLTSLNEDADRSAHSPTLRELSRRALENAVAPINKLPTEMLLEVFRHFVTHLSIHEPTGDRPPEWLPLMGVCRSWCVLVRSTPTIWSSAIVIRHGNLRWLELSLARSRETPASLAISLPDVSFDSELCSTVAVRSHSHHIRQLFFTTVLTLRNKRSVKDLMDTSLPALTTLYLDLAYRLSFHHVPGVPITAKMVLDRDRYPSLTHLHLKVGLIPSWTSSVFKNLQYLSLISCRLSTHHVSLTQFLDALENGGQHLESITLGGFLTATVLAESPEVEPDRVGTLPRIRTLRLIWEDAACISRLASHLRLPASGEIDLQGTLASPDELYDPQFARLLPHYLRRIPFLHAATALEVDVHNPRIKISGNVSGHQALMFSISLHQDYSAIDDHPLWISMLGDALAQVVALFVDAPLRSLTVQGALEMTRVQAWDAVFATFSRLESVKLCMDSDSDDRYYTALPLFLYHTLGVSRTTSFGTPDHVGDLLGPLDADGVTVRCPALQTLDIQGAYWTPLHSRSLGQVLEMREQAGAPRLPRLILAPHIPENEELSVLKSLEESLQPFVHDLLFSSRVGGGGGDDEPGQSLLTVSHTYR